MGNGPTAEIPVKDFVATFETNLLGVVRVSSVVVKSAMIPQAREDRRRAGRIVTIGSIVGFAPMAFNAGYDCSKGKACWLEVGAPSLTFPQWLSIV